MYLSDHTGYSYNLEFTRFIFAMMVILNHSFPLSTGSMENEWLYALSRNQLTMGMIAVVGFFLCGGYYAARTMIEKKKKYYPLKRIRRLLPELVLVVISCTVLGVFVSVLFPKEYFTNIKTARYLLNGMMILQHELPGVFENNVYTSTVNGALWTLPVEYLCDIGLFVIWKIGILDKKRFLFTVPVTVISGVLIWRAGSTYGDLRSAVMAGIFFYLGVVFYIYREYILLSFGIFAGLGILLIILFVAGHAGYSLYLCFPYLCFYIWMNDKKVSQHLSALGKYSYAVYLWGFPVQQTVVHFYGGSMNPYICFAISAPVAVMLGVVTRKLIDRFGKRLLFGEISQ